MRNKTAYIIITFLISILILWFLCPFLAENTQLDGHLPSVSPNAETAAPTVNPTASPNQSEKQSPFNYYTITRHEPDFDLSMHILEFDPSNEEAELLPVTSHKNLFGYAYLSEMNEKWNALACINGGFSHTNGLLGGLYAIDGELLTPATGQYPVLFMSRGKAFISDAVSRVWLEADGSKIESIHFNKYPGGEGLFLFTPRYGTANRLSVNHLNAVISKGEVRGLIERRGSYEIPKDGFLLSAIGEYSKNRLKNSLTPGMLVEYKFEIEGETGIISDYDWAYECGSWILKDGKVVVPKSDTWVGTLQNRTPRTAVGIREDGTMLFVVVDGRQKGLSHGLTGEELAYWLNELGARDAVFLDGGASSEMIVNGEIVNSPSAGRERMVASSFVIVKK